MRTTQPETEAGDSVSWTAVDRGSRAANAIHHHLTSTIQTQFVSRVYLAEKGQALVDALRAMGVEIR